MDAKAGYYSLQRGRLKPTHLMGYSFFCVGDGTVSGRLLFSQKDCPWGSLGCQHPSHLLPKFFDPVSPFVFALRIECITDIDFTMNGIFIGAIRWWDQCHLVLLKVSIPETKQQKPTPFCTCTCGGTWQLVHRSFPDRTRLKRTRQPQG